MELEQTFTEHKRQSVWAIKEELYVAKCTDGLTISDLDKEPVIVRLYSSLDIAKQELACLQEEYTKRMLGVLFSEEEPIEAMDLERLNPFYYIEEVFLIERPGQLTETAEADYKSALQEMAYELKYEQSELEEPDPILAEIIEAVDADPPPTVDKTLELLELAQQRRRLLLL